MYKIVGVYNRGEKYIPKNNDRYSMRVGKIVSAETVMFATVGAPINFKIRKRRTWK